MAKMNYSKGRSKRNKSTNIRLRKGTPKPCRKGYKKQKLNRLRAKKKSLDTEGDNLVE